MTVVATPINRLNLHCLPNCCITCIATDDKLHDSIVPLTSTHLISNVCIHFGGGVAFWLLKNNRESLRQCMNKTACSADTFQVDLVDWQESTFNPLKIVSPFPPLCRERGVTGSLKFLLAPLLPDSLLNGASRAVPVACRHFDAVTSAKLSCSDARNFNFCSHAQASHLIFALASADRTTKLSHDSENRAVNLAELAR